MALRFDATADVLQRTSDLLSFNGAYTLMGWVKLSSDIDAAGVIWALTNAGGTQIDAVLLDTNGTTLANYVNGPGPASGSLTAGTWVHLTSRRTATNNLDLLTNGTVTTSNTTATSGSRTQDAMYVGSFAGAGNRADIVVAGLKAWSVALTDAEIAREIRTLRPHRTSNLYGWWPAAHNTAANAARDLSGSARHWTTGGTLTIEDGPPVPWGAAALLAGAPASVAVNVSDSAAGTESASLSVTLGPADTGAGGDAGAVAASTSQANSGAGADSIVAAPSIAPTDASAGTEAAELNAAAGVSDSASGADAGAPAVALELADAAAGADAVDVQQQVTAIDVSDSAAGSDTMALEAGVAGTDSSAGAEQQAANAALGVSDGAAGADAGAPSVAHEIADSAVGAEVASLVASIEPTDSAAGSDAAEAAGDAEVAVGDNAQGSDQIIVVDLTPRREQVAGDDEDTDDEELDEDMQLALALITSGVLTCLH